MKQVIVYDWQAEPVHIDHDDPNARILCCGSYDVPQIMGTATTGGPYDVFERKRYPGRIEKKVVMPMHWGNIAEHPFRIRAQQVLEKLGLSPNEKVVEGETVYSTQFMYTARSTPDAVLEGNPDVVFEFKTRWWTDKDLYGDEMTDDCQAQEYDQCQWHMYVTGAKVCFLGVWFHPAQDITWFQIDRDEDRIAEISGACFVFWTNHLQPNVPPPTDETEGCREYWARVEAREKTKREMCAEEYGLALEYDQLKMQEQQTKEKLTEIGNRLRSMMGDHLEIYRPGEKVKVTHKPVKNRATRSFRVTVGGKK